MDDAQRSTPATVEAPSRSVAAALWTLVVLFLVALVYGMVRDYEVKLEGTQRTTRARIAIPISEQRIVIITYVPITRIDIPPEAREKLGGAGAASRSPGTR